MDEVQQPQAPSPSQPSRPVARRPQVVSAESLTQLRQQGAAQSPPQPPYVPSPQSPPRAGGMEGVVAILPTLNEERGVELVINGLRQAGVGEIIVVDGNSTDRTVAVAREKGAIVMTQEGKGKGAAFRTFLDAYPLDDSSIYVMLDADSSYDPGDCPLVVSKLRQGYEVVAGSRRVLIYDLRSLLHVLGGKAISVFASVLFLKRISDVTTGYWAFRGSALKKMHLTANGFDLEADIFSQAAKRGLKLGQVQVSYQKRVGEAKLTTVDALGIVVSLLKFRF